MVKTDTQHVISSAGRDAVSRAKTGNDVRDAQKAAGDGVRSPAGDVEPEDGNGTVDVARAQDIYARTEQVARATVDKVIDTPEEAASLAAEVTSQVREHGAEAVKAQASGVSAHLVELLDKSDIG